MQLVISLVKLCILVTTISLYGCDDKAWNDPYPNQKSNADILYSAFTEQPKHLDPARAYAADGWRFMAQIYEPVLEYNYLQRPYTLQPLTAKSMPTVHYDKINNITSYIITIQKDILYQPHPAFAKDAKGYIYHNLNKRQALKYKELKDFKEIGTRELVAEDYVYQIKRLADPKVNSPIFGFLSPYIKGFYELRQELTKAYADNPQAQCLDLRKFELSGAKLIDDHTYEIKINGQYPQFIYWLQMLFFAPVPHEAMTFYCQEGLEAHNINLDTYPIGTGAFYMSEINPQRRIIMRRNPNYHNDYYPETGSIEDMQYGYLENAGKKLPLIDGALYSIERESIPYWDKFMQGYYDRSGITSNNFNNALSQVTSSDIQLSKDLIEKGISLSVESNLSIAYWGFNMQDSIVGGYSDKAKYLRQAINMAFDIDEFILIFLNGRGIATKSPIPPGILGYSEQNSHSVYNLAMAKKLLAKAGYPDGISADGKRLQINYDVVGSGDPNQRALLGWITKQFEKLNIDLIIKSTDFNRFLDKRANGMLQFFTLAWNMDYPDPENILFLFYGPNSAISDNGENSTNYNNPKFNILFEKFKNIDNDSSRLQLINEMLTLLQEDTPWVGQFFTEDYILANNWYYPVKPNAVANNTLKYVRVDPLKRAKARIAWNKPILWPMGIALLVILLLFIPAVIGYYYAINAKAKRVPK